MFQHNLPKMTHSILILFLNSPKHDMEYKVVLTIYSNTRLVIGGSRNMIETMYFAAYCLVHICLHKFLDETCLTNITAMDIQISAGGHYPAHIFVITHANSKHSLLL